MSFKSTMKRWGDATVDEIAKEIKRIHSENKYKNTGKGLHEHNKYARKMLNDLGLVMTYKMRDGNVVENY